MHLRTKPCIGAYPETISHKPARTPRNARPAGKKKKFSMVCFFGRNQPDTTEAYPAEEV